VTKHINNLELSLTKIDAEKLSGESIKSEFIKIRNLRNFYTITVNKDNIKNLP
jgi:hypothetical protein